MPDYKPNRIVRVFAVLALAVAFVAVVAVIATSGGSDSGDNGATQVQHKESKAGRRAVDRGVWIVRPGDTLGHISEATGIDIDTLTQLNPDLDPQALLEGQRIHLR